MGPAKRIAFIEHEVCVGQIQSADDDGPVPAKSSGALKVDDRMRRLVVGAIALEESGAVVNGARHPGDVRQSHVDATGKGVALIVIEKKELVSGRLERRQAAANGAAAFDELMRIGQMHFCAAAAR